MTRTQAFEDANVINTWDVLKRFAPKGRDVAISYVPRDSRACRSPHYAVWSPSHQTAPNAAWYDHGQKTFLCSGKENRAAALAEAKAWAKARYGINDWAPSPPRGGRGDLVPADVRDRAIASVERPSKPRWSPPRRSR